MIEAKYYYDFYLLIVSILTIVASNSYFKSNGISHIEYNGLDIDIRPVCLVIFLTFFIGSRSTYGFGDTTNYTNYYNLIEGRQYIYNPTVANKIWDNLFYWWASEGLGISNFYIVIAFLYFGGTYLACRKLFNQDQYIAFLVFLGSFSTFSYSVNGIKAGAAAAIFLVGLSYYKKWFIGIPLVLISWGFHHSMVLSMAAFVVAYFYRNSKVYFYLWIICLLISALHITFFQSLFASMAEEQGDLQGAGYLSTDGNEWGGTSGFRIDFVIYSAMPVVVGYYTIFKRKLHIGNSYKMILNIYMLTNSVWMLCMFANFTNRIAYLSWFLFPMVLIYPLLNENWGPSRYKTLSKLVLANLAFTLFMNYVYY